MKIKRLLLALCFFVLAINTSVYAEIKIRVNERTVAMDTSPYIANNYTLVPIRFVAEALDFEDIVWEESKRTVTVKGGATEIFITIDSQTALVNGERVSLGTPARIKNNRTYIPVRFVAENMGAEVSWDGEKRVVNILKNGAAGNFPYEEDELFWLARIIHAEARGENAEGKLAVGNVVLNRVKNSEFPNTIYGVIFDRKNGVQFTPVANGEIYNTPSNECYYAADRALRGENAAGESLFFCNPEISENLWIINSRPLFSVIGKHNFYL